MVNYTRHPASFKDPSGFVFETGGTIHRQVNKSYALQYQQLMSSGLYQHLVNHQQLITHTELQENITGDEEWFTTLVPEPIPHITYPYEWCFEQLRDAALLTLGILKTAVSYGMILKDATPFNIQFIKGRPVFIDTLSFDTYDAQQPWIAYRQFCQSFLFPLYLEHYLKTDVQKILSTYIDGIPVDIIAKLLPLKSRLSLGVWLHVYLQHSASGMSKGTKQAAAFNKKKLMDLVSHLQSILHNFPADRPIKTTWSNYYDDTILSQDYLAAKETVIRGFMETISASSVLDLGANDGYFSKLFAGYKLDVIATDSDSRCINKLYKEVRKNAIHNILPLVLDIANPTPAVGFHNRERNSFHERIQTDLVAALALIHHLVIGRNISLPALASYFNDIAPQLIIEFVPKEDDKVKQMLHSRPDTFPDYDQSHFEKYFSTYFTIHARQTISGTHRLLYHLVRK